MGKNFSCNNVTGKRKESDFYETPYWLTRLFLNTGALDKTKPTLEPASGNGAIVRILKEYEFADITSFDLMKDNRDFLAWKDPVPQIITNPPYSLAFEFVQHAKEVATERFAMLLPLAYLHGKKRYDHIYSDDAYPLDSVYVFTRYPLLGEELREDGKTHTGMMVFAWLLWDKIKPSHVPTLHWLDNDFAVVGKGD